MTDIYQKKIKNSLKVYFIMGSNNCKSGQAITVLEKAIAGGITCFQFREKGNGARTGQEKYALAEELQYICRKNNIPFIVNDDIDLAIEINADGIHIGQEDDPVRSVREKIGSKILGVSVHNQVEAEIALKEGADYFGVGPIFPTLTKEDAKAVQGVEIIQDFRRKGYTIPIVGIGGITIENAANVIHAGADGISIISAISLADDPKAAATAIATQVLSGF